MEKRKTYGERAETDTNREKESDSQKDRQEAKEEKSSPPLSDFHFPPQLYNLDHLPRAT